MTLTFFSTSPNNITANSSNQDALQPPTDQHLSIATHKKVLGFTPTRYSGYKNVGLAERKIFDIDACVAAGMFDVVLAATTPKMTPSKRFKTTAWLNKSLKVHDQQVFVLKSLDRDDTLYPRDIGLASLALQKFNLCKEMGGFRPKLWGPTLRGQIATLAADIKKLLRDPFAISDA
ncbi:MAG: hypothetical protein ACXWJZ_15065, partial [Burkholderiaceae bacterium]